MKDINNNVLNYRNEPNLSYNIEVSQKLAEFHASCFTNSEKRYSEKSMLFFIEKPIYHIFYNHISLVIIQIIGEESELITLSVDSKRRRKGIGYELLKSSIIYLEDLDIKKLFLEVATTNKIALELYHKVGFTACGLRKGYYVTGTGNKTDATIMSYNMRTKVTKTLKSDKKKLQNL